MKKRPKELRSSTYILNSPKFKKKLYVTIADIEEENQIKPFEIFFNSSDSRNFIDLQIISKLVSAIMRESTNICLVPYELMSIVGDADMHSYFRPPRKGETAGREIPTVYYEIGEIILEHLKKYSNIKCNGKKIETIKTNTQ